MYKKCKFFKKNCGPQFLLKNRGKIVYSKNIYTNSVEENVENIFIAKTGDYFIEEIVEAIFIEKI